MKHLQTLAKAVGAAALMSGLVSGQTPPPGSPPPRFRRPALPRQVEEAGEGRRASALPK